MDDILWEQTDSPAVEDLAAVDDGLESANRTAADLNSIRPLASFARSPSGELIGGATARTWGKCCEIRQVWVAPSHRRRGIARRLLEIVEAEARHRECTLLYLETFTFQAPQLYRSLGFDVACQFTGFPGGEVKYIMRKELADKATRHR
jgi:GNAT superfamily N-acetyltransferase